MAGFCVCCFPTQIKVFPHHHSYSLIPCLTSFVSPSISASLFPFLIFSVSLFALSLHVSLSYNNLTLSHFLLPSLFSFLSVPCSFPLPLSLSRSSFPPLSLSLSLSLF